MNERIVAAIHDDKIRFHRSTYDPLDPSMFLGMVRGVPFEIQAVGGEWFISIGQDGHWVAGFWVDEIKQG